MTINYSCPSKDIKQTMLLSGEQHGSSNVHTLFLLKADHEYWERSRKLVQPTKKMNCPAAIHIRLVVRFPTYKVIA